MIFSTCIAIMTTIQPAKKTQGRPIGGYDVFIVGDNVKVFIGCFPSIEDCQREIEWLTQVADSETSRNVSIPTPVGWRFHVGINLLHTEKCQRQMPSCYEVDFSLANKLVPRHQSIDQTRVARCYPSLLPGVFWPRFVQPPQVWTELLNSLSSPHILHLPVLTGPLDVPIIQWCGRLVVVMLGASYLVAL